MTPWLYELDYYHWMLAGLVLLVLDGFTRSSLFMWLGFSLFGEGLLVLLLPYLGIHPAWNWQFISFAVLAVFFLWIWRRYEFDRERRRLMGRRLILQAPIRDGHGEALVDGRRLPLTGPDVPAGTTVEIDAADAVAFHVKPVDNTRP